MNKQITEHFNSSEFNCHDGTPVPEKYLPNLERLCINLEVLRSALYNNPIKILSGYRTPTYNKQVEGAKKSMHMTAAAGDITVLNFTPLRVYQTIEHMIGMSLMEEGGLGLYDGWVHYDVRGYKARWDYSTQKLATI